MWPKVHGNPRIRALPRTRAQGMVIVYRSPKERALVGAKHRKMVHWESRRTFTCYNVSVPCNV